MAGFGAERGGKRAPSTGRCSSTVTRSWSPFVPRGRGCGGEGLRIKEVRGEGSTAQLLRAPRHPPSPARSRPRAARRGARGEAELWLSSRPLRALPSPGAAPALPWSPAAPGCCLLRLGPCPFALSASSLPPSVRFRVQFRAGRAAAAGPLGAAWRQSRAPGPTAPGPTGTPLLDEPRDSEMPPVTQTAPAASTPSSIWSGLILFCRALAAPGRARALGARRARAHTHVPGVPVPSGHSFAFPHLLPLPSPSFGGSRGPSWGFSPGPQHRAGSW